MTDIRDGKDEILWGRLDSTDAVVDDAGDGVA